MHPDENEEKLLRAVALQNAKAILLARERTERELIAAKEALSESKQNIAEILESITDGLVTMDRDWRLTYLNRKGEEILQALKGSTESLIGKFFWNEFPQLLGRPAEWNFRRAMQEQVTAEYETFVPSVRTWFNVRAYPSKNGISVYFHDITERKQAEEELRQQNEWFQVTLSSIGDAVIATDINGRVIFINPRAEAMTGWKSSEARGRPFEEIFNVVHEQTRKPATYLVKAVLRGAGARELANHSVLIARDGAEIPVEDSVAPIRDAEGKVTGAVMVFHDVTERRRAQEALRASEQRLLATFNQAAVGMAVAALDGHFEQANRRFSEILGYSLEELRKHSFADLTHPEDLARTRAQIDRLLAGEIAEYVEEKRYVRKDGGIVWSLTSITLLNDPAGKPQRFIAVIEDVTERKKAEEAAREGAQRLHLALSAARLGNWSWEAPTDSVTLGPEAAEILGLPADARPTWQELLGLLEEECRESARLAVEQALAVRSDYTLEYPVTRPGEGRRWIMIRGRGLYAESGTLLGMIGVVQDITERKRSEEVRFRLAAVVESSDDAILSMTLDGIITTWNAGAERMFGYTAAEAIGKSVTILIPAGREDEEPHILDRLKRGERVDHYETVRVRKDGAVLHVSLTVSPIHDAGGRIIGASKISRDITERKRAEEALREETRILELLNRTGAAIASTLDLQTLLQTVADAATQLSGARFRAFFYCQRNRQDEPALIEIRVSGSSDESFRTLAESRGAGIVSLSSRENRVIRLADILADPGCLAPEMPIGLGEGPALVRSYLEVPVISRDGEVIGGLILGHPEPHVFTERAERLLSGVAAQAAIAIDHARLYDAAQREIAQRKRAEEALREAQAKLSHHAEDLEHQVAERTASLRETIGELEAFSYSISHDMRAPLRAMQSFALILADECSSQVSPEGKEYIRRITTAAERLDKLIQDVLTYSRLARAELRLEPVDVEKLLRDILDTYPMFHPGAVDIRLIGSFPIVLGAEAVLTQCFSNLLSNAVKFVEAGVTPRVDVWAETLKKERKARILFKDNGLGIEKGSHETIFGIFQRLSHHYEGTGIGLAIVKKGVERMGGSVSLLSEPGRGSTFWLELKLAETGGS